ncbi:MAG: agmatine deiminase family protein [Bacteroidetes bacterium]|nr:agmatine deiminase family protein [Bacteroidota bacterium]
MITDNETDIVYISSLLEEKHNKFHKQFISLLNELEIKWKILANTKDIWCRDFMPVQIDEERFLQFSFNPDYLRDEEYQHLRTNPDLVCEPLSLNPLKSNLIIDGGNIVKSKSKVIVTDKIYDENDMLPEHEIRREIRELLGVDEIISIPQEPCDVTGHADGMVRFINENEVLLNDYSPFMPSFHRDLLEIFSEHNLKVNLFPYKIFNTVNKDKVPSAKGNYINYLQLEDIIIIPEYGMKEDADALSAIQNIFPNHTIRSIDCNSIAEEGGVLNCITWNIRKNKK